ncbi:Gfo/Idh/MocA family oxidoreductase [Gracilibacillus dipsosauri]|uniref:Gfo/Idh/MocA family oxidoreductase n=1 Tax=Gracilibacillus dipsosauri TaxID=178340 RepID=UPI00240A68A8
MLKLGIIGMNEGNGHPYSWSAICNGYDPEYMQDCPFPTIPQYLSEKKFPDDAIKCAKVTHIWTQDRTISQHIARSANIAHIVDKKEEMIGKVDAILLARDDYENHLINSEIFIEAGLPIYIDKPLAIHRKKAEEILLKEKEKGQIFSCSALKYATEYNLAKDRLKRVGKIKSIHAVVMKSWEKYAIHVIDPILRLIGYHHLIQSSTVTKSDGVVHVNYLTQDDVLINITVVEEAIYLPFRITLIGTDDYMELEMKDTFLAFKSSLEKFIGIVTRKEAPLSHEEMLKTVEFIEAGI